MTKLNIAFNLLRANAATETPLIQGLSRVRATRFDFSTVLCAIAQNIDPAWSSVNAFREGGCDFCFRAKKLNLSIFC